MITNHLLGEIHLYSALLATAFGTYVLLAKKGTRTHKKIGYLYLACMLLLNITAFMIYRLFGTFGIFHLAAVISLTTVMAGMVPAIRRRTENWAVYHLRWMYWSVIGLYAAFASETLTRIPKTPFFGMVGIATGAIIIIGMIVFAKKFNIWKNKFEHLKPKKS